MIGNAPATWSSPEETVRAASTDLARQLARTAPGKGWDEFLDVEELSTLQAPQDGPVSEQQLQQIHDTLNKYDRVAAEEQYRTISRLPGFVAVHKALHAYLEPPWERSRRDLTWAFEQLDKSLRRFKNGSSWIDYLALPEVMTSGGSDEFRAQRPWVEQLVKRFEKLNNDSMYRKVAALPGFQASRAALTRFMNDSAPQP